MYQVDEPMFQINPKYYDLSTSKRIDTLVAMGCFVNERWAELYREKQAAETVEAKPAQPTTGKGTPCPKCGAPIVTVPYCSNDDCLFEGSE